ncbi:MAG TPA: hypothetical protein VND21_08130 [Planctomycetota bacterium]|nr:hypothetical protein [Planctomycetota bacterium]
MAARRRSRPFAILAAVLLCAGVVVGAPQRGRPRWTYRVRVAEDLRSLDVRLEFERFTPRRLWMVDGRPVRNVEVLPESGIRLVPDPTGDEVLLADEVRAPHLHYRVDLTRPSSARSVTRATSGVLTHASSWMLRPALVPPDLEATVVFDLPDDVHVEAPWERIGAGATFRVPRTSWEFVGHVAFGRLTTVPFEASGAAVRLVRLGDPVAAGDDGLRRWIEDAVRADALPYGGRFPERRLTVFVVPVPEARSAVPFGSAWFGGGPHVVLLVGGQASERALRDDWTAVHEIFHTTMPPIAREDAWLAEGFATWHQESLRGRAGLQTPERTWSEIESGFARGRARGGDLPLGEESRAMHENHTYHRVYWAGAAIALLLDVDLRRSSQGARSLDDVMRWLREIPGGLSRPVPASEAIAFVDARLGEPRFARIAAAWLERPEFPDVDPARAWLGVTKGDGGRVALLEGAPGAATRSAMTAPSRHASGNAR